MVAAVISPQKIRLPSESLVRPAHTSSAQASYAPTLKHQMDTPTVNLDAAHSIGAAAPEQVSPTDDVPAESPPPTEAREPLSEAELRAQAAIMQDQLGFILTNIKEIKDNCKRLKTQNQSLQEYIESLMARR